MALSGVGNGGADALARFQQLRGAAQKKLDGADRQTDLAELIRRKQEQLGAGKAPATAARTQAERIPPGPGRSAGAAGPGAAPAGNIEAGQAASAVYGRTGITRKQEAAPRLGQYVDFRA